MLTPRALEDLWSRFKNRGDQRARGAIIDNYTYLVKITAGRVVANLPPNMDRDDLITAGSMGLVKAVDQFDSGRQVKFETYAIALIRGAILESLREDDWVPRSVRERSRNLSRTMVELEAFLEIHEAWRRLGYPFESLAPSYASALGSSASSFSFSP